MDPLALIGLGASVVVTAVGATWALRAKLSDIEVAIKGHIEKDEETHRAQEARIIKLEGRTRGGRR